jgi:membrane protease YdiL (CAAX protease family)
MVEVLVLGGALLAYSNGLALWCIRRGRFPERLFQRLNPALIAAMLAYSAARYNGSGGLAAVGLHHRDWLKAIAGGACVGLALAVPPLLFFYRPILLDTPMEYGPIARLTRRQLLREVLVGVPIGIALLEELAFRGLLYSALRRCLLARWAIAGTSAAFAGWHLTVTATSAAQTNIATAARLPAPLRPFTMPIAVAGGMLSTGLAGAAFGLLRERTGSLLGPIIAHWVVDGLMMATLWLRSGERVRRQGRTRHTSAVHKAR